MLKVFFSPSDSTIPWVLSFHHQGAVSSICSSTLLVTNTEIVTQVLTQHRTSSKTWVFSKKSPNKTNQQNQLLSLYLPTAFYHIFSFVPTHKHWQNTQHHDSSTVMCHSYVLETEFPIVTKSSAQAIPAMDSTYFIQSCYFCLPSVGQENILFLVTDLLCRRWP